MKANVEGPGSRKSQTSNNSGSYIEMAFLKQWDSILNPIEDNSFLGLTLFRCGTNRAARIFKSSPGLILFSPRFRGTIQEHTLSVPEESVPAAWETRVGQGFSA